LVTLGARRWIEVVGNTELAPQQPALNNERMTEWLGSAGFHSSTEISALLGPVLEKVRAKLVAK